MTDAQNDTSELDARVEDWAKSIGFGVVHIPKKGEQWLNPELSGRYDLKDLRFWYEHVGSPRPYSRPEPDRELWSSAMSIVNPILDLANIDVVKRQEINDSCDDIAMAVIAQREQAAELRGFMLGQGYAFVATPGVSYANGYYEKAEDDGTTTVCNEYIAQQKFLQATKPDKEG